MNNPNQKPYDKNDNDTYVEKYSPGMVRDVEMHMFRNEKSHVYSGGMFGNFSTESRIAASNNVLHFQKASNLDLKLIKEVTMKSLIPFSLMKRYEHELIDVGYTQKIPVFFDIVNEKFVVSLDERVLRDLGKESKFESDVRAIPEVKIKETDFGLQVLINYDSMKDLLADTSNVYKKVKSAYLRQMLDIYPTDDVIITTYKLESNKESYFSDVSTATHIVNQHNMPKIDIQNSNISFEFFKARKVGNNKFFVYDKEGNLNNYSYIHIDKERAKSDKQYQEKISQTLFIKLNDDKLHTVSVYKEEDWNALNDIKSNISSVFKDLESLLLKQKTQSVLDEPISEIDFNNSLKLEFKTQKTLGFKK